MFLIYRGQIAQPSTSAQTIETGVNGTFLGRFFPIRKAQRLTHRAAPYLQYRGVIYSIKDYSQQELEGIKPTPA